MTGLVLGGLILVVVLAFMWSRVGGIRSERRAMKEYGHALGVLGEVTRRGAHQGEPTKPTDHEASPPAPTPIEPPPAASPRIAPPPVTKLSFGDDAVTPEMPEVVESPHRAARIPSTPGHRVRGRVVVGGAAAAVALAAVGVVAARALDTPATPHGQPVSLPRPKPHKPSASSGSHQSEKHRPAQANPRTLTPTSTSSSVVAFSIPRASYTVTFADTGTQDCWIGVQASVSSTSWLWMTTLAPGQTAQYRATGPVVAKLGAPRNVGVSVDGIPAQLPGFVLPYDLSFTPGSTPASA